MKLRSTKTSLQLILVGLVLIMGFNNCSGKHAGSSEDGGDLNSASAANCEEKLYDVFVQNVYPFVANNDTCLNCHVEGGQGIGTFASPNSKLAFTAFRGVGWQKISLKAVDLGHKQPYTGPKNKTAVDNINVLWPKAENDYLSCLAKGNDGTLEETLQTSEKSAPNIYTNRNEQTLTWDLENATDLDSTSQRSVPAVFSIKVRVLYNSETPARPIGYAFTDPNIILKRSGLQLIVEGLYLYMNGQLVSNLSTFTSVSKIVATYIPPNGDPYVPYTLLKASGSALVQPISTDDTFAFYFRRIVPTSESEASPTPSAPILSLTDPDTGSEKFIRGTSVVPNIVRDNGISRWCLTTDPNRPPSTDDPCPGQVGNPGTVNGWFITKPNLFQVPPGDGAKQVYLWVANGALRINTAISTDTITLDSVPPTKPAILSINGNTVVNNGIGAGNIGNLQVAPMVISTNADVKSWCVFEQSSTAADPTSAPNSNNACWRWSYDGTQPTTIGFKGGGPRKIFLWVRDEAGNVSQASDFVQVNNPHGAITYSKLTLDTTTTTDAAKQEQAVFFRECRECHLPADQPGYQKLRLFDYNEALRVADNGLVVARTNNPNSPMPNKNNGLMDKKYRDLIRLWLLPEGGGDPLF